MRTSNPMSRPGRDAGGLTREAAKKNRYHSVAMAVAASLVLVVFSSNSGWATDTTDPAVPDSDEAQSVTLSSEGPPTSDGGTGVTANAAGPGGTIDCLLQAQTPHNSSHVPGTINEIGTIDCGGDVVSSLTISVDLYKRVCTPDCTWRLMASSPAKLVLGKAFVQQNVAIACSPGTYRGAATGTATFPPGYTPTAESGGAWSATKALTC